MAELLSNKGVIQPRHRYLPAEGSRHVAEPTKTHPTKLAGEVSFKPVTTVKTQDQNIYVKPVKNTHQRAISTQVLSHNGQIAVHGERTVGMDKNLHEQLKTKVNKATQTLVASKPTVAKKYINPADLEPQHFEVPKPTLKQEPTVPAPVSSGQTVVKPQIPVPPQAVLSVPKPRTENQIGVVQKPTLQMPKPPTQSTLEQQQPVTTAPPNPNNQQLHSETRVPSTAHSNIPTQAPIKSPEHKADQDYNAKLKAQLEQINKTLFEQIKIKIASELAKQPTQVKPEPKVTEVPKSVKDEYQGKTEPKHQTPSSTTQNLKDSPQVPVREFSASKPTAKAAVPEHWEEPKVTEKIPEKPVVQPDHSKEDYKSHVDKLEKEIKRLSEEVSDLDKTVSGLSKDSNNTDLASLERRIEVDQKMLAAVAEWRLALNNLINSHTIALRYLKNKVDSLETKPPLKAEDIVKLSNHEEHKKHFVKSESIPIMEFPKLTTANIAVQPTTDPTVEPTTNVPAIVVQREVQSTSFEAVKDLVKQALEKETPPTPDKQVVSDIVKEVVKTEPPQGLKPDKSSVEQAVKEIIATVPPTPTPPDKQVVSDIVKEVVKTEPLQGVKPDEAAVKELVKEVVKNEPLQTVSKPDQDTVNEMVREALKSELPKVSSPTPSTPIGQNNTVYVKEVDKNATIPDSAQTGVVINTQAVAPAPTAAPMVSSADIEKQILEAAAKEESVKEAARQAKEAAEKKLKEEKQKQEEQVAQAAKVAGDVAAGIISPEALKSEFDKLKASLTTIDNKQLASLSRDQRTEMIRNLENLEKQSLVTKQLDEIKATTERRRINNELAAMLHRIGEKPSEPVPSNQTTQQKVETLKGETKIQTSPSDKARIIAEIKELERQAAAKKAAAASKPVVRAQPAFGKMLPNTPTIPNVINGIVKDNKGLLLSTVVIIVKDKDNEPVRAFKSNKIGQFALSTPVPNGVYTLELEKEGYDFDIIEVEVNGSIMQPIEIKAR